MRRAILVFVLALSICFQGPTLAGQVVARDRGGDAAHDHDSAFIEGLKRPPRTTA